MHPSRGTPDPLRPQGPRYKENSMRSSRRQFLQLLGAGAAAATGIDVPSGFAQAAGPVKIGVLAIRAGIAAPVGAAGLRGTEWWAERVNKAGGILGRPVQLVVEEESNPKDTVERYRKLVLQDQVEVVLGGISTDVKFVLELFPKLGVTDFSSHIPAIQQSKADLLMCSFWSGDATIIMKQAAAVGLFKTMKGVFTTAGGVHDSLKKEFTPEGLLLGYNTMYFDDPKASPLLEQFVREYKAKYNEYPPYECDHAYFCAESYKAAVRKAPRPRRQWPEKAQVVKALEGIEVESLSGRRSWREDHIQMCNFYQGVTTHKNTYDFVTIDPIEVVSTKVAMKPAGSKLFDWINSWKI